MITSRRPRRLLYGLLAASVAVNLVGAGYLAAVSLKPKPPRTVDSVIEFASGRYPGAFGEAVRGRLEARRGDIAKAFEETRAARRATRDALSASPLDQAKAEAAFSQARARMDAFQAMLHAATVEAMSDVDDDARRKVSRKDED